MKLTDAFIKAIKPSAKPATYPDGKGLVLLSNPNGVFYGGLDIAMEGMPRCFL